MSNTLTNLRQELADTLTGAGLEAVAFLPERPNPPVAVVSPSQPYLKPGDTFGQHTATLTVLLLTRTATNEIATEALDDMIVTVAVALTDTQFSMSEADQPASFQVGTAKYLGCTIDVSRTGFLEVD